MSTELAPILRELAAYADTGPRKIKAQRMADIWAEVTNRAIVEECAESMLAAWRKHDQPNAEEALALAEIRAARRAIRRELALREGSNFDAEALARAEILARCRGVHAAIVAYKRV